MRPPARAFWVSLAAVAVLSAVAVPAGASSVATYEVTITNLTAGQPLTPFVVATHSGALSIFRVGSPASEAVKEIAENGNPAPLLELLEASGAVADVQAGTFPLVPESDPGGTGLPDSVTFEIDGALGARFISWDSMLICTNDGFTGVSGLRLPARLGQSVTASTFGYDAGTEINTEDFADIVPPCQGLIGVTSTTGETGTGTSNPALAEGGVIHHHEGIVGDADLVPTVHGWDTSAPVAEITVTRIA
jgi:hypothetical protein